MEKTSTGQTPTRQVATGNNRVNSSGNSAAVGPLGRTSIIYPVIVPAAVGGNPTVVPIPCAGTTFYVTVATAAIDIRPASGVFNTYTAGRGLKLREVNAFPFLEARNTNAFPVVVQLFVGFDDFIDNTLILNQTGQNLVAYPTYPTPNAAANVNIIDQSGAAFLDINNNRWFALGREAIYVFNPDAGVTLLLQKFGSAVANGPAVGIIYPTTSLRYRASGNYCLNVGGGNINAVVSEIYNAIPGI